MDQADIRKLLEKYDKGECTAEEKAMLDSWYLQTAAAHQDDLPAPDFKKAEAKLNQALNILEGKRSNSYYKYVAAAAVAFIIFGAGLFYFNRQPGTSSKTAYSNDVAPGKQGATLTLANGKRIRLSGAANGELAKEAGVSVTKTADGQIVYSMSSLVGGTTKQSYNTLSTAKGESYQVRLPDGSLVFLNAASSLTYAVALNTQGKRMVKLLGEGYFEVVKDKKHPFIVESKGQAIEVLGTHFNVNAYENEPVIKTTLLEGSVKVSGHGHEEMLSPGYEAVNSGSGIKIDKADTELAVAWKDNKFVFADEKIEAVMKMVERWYDVKIVYQGDLPEERFRGSVSRFDNVSRVLHILESTGSVHFKIEGRTIYVNK